jgi:hypothetical protein
MKMQFSFCEDLNGAVNTTFRMQQGKGEQSWMTKVISFSYLRLYLCEKLQLNHESAAEFKRIV